MKLLVIGDTCIDIFVYGSCGRICPEAPVPVFRPTKTVTNPGMAGNVVENIKALGCDCDKIVSCERIVKIRYVESKTNQMIMRLDENDFVEHRYVRDAEKLKGYDGIIISDYGKGFLDEDDIAFISNNTAGCPTFLQTNKVLSDWCTRIDFIKINETEYKKTKHVLDKLKWNIENSLIVTLGSRGCMFKRNEYPVDVVGVKSLAGAGDTFLAGLCVSYIENKHDIDKAIHFAQVCAMKVVQFKGVTTV